MSHLPEALYQYPANILQPPAVIANRMGRVVRLDAPNDNIRRACWIDSARTWKPPPPTRPQLSPEAVMQQPDAALRPYTVQLGAELFDGFLDLQEAEGFARTLVSKNRRRVTILLGVDEVESLVPRDGGGLHIDETAFGARLRPPPLRSDPVHQAKSLVRLFEASHIRAARQRVALRDVQAVLKRVGVPAVTDHRLGPKAIPSLYMPASGLAVEVAGTDSQGEVIRHRLNAYAAQPEVRVLLLVAPFAGERLVQIGTKPFFMARIGRS